jgi:hypothetical protein
MTQTHHAAPPEGVGTLPEIAPAAPLRALLDSLVDYAGLFPPASLPLGESITNYARYRASRSAWMLGDFVVPASRFEALGAHAGLFGEVPPFRFSALVGGGPDAATCLARLSDDVAEIDRFTKRHAGRVRVAATEMRLPEALFGATISDLRTFLLRVAEVYGGRGVQVERVFVEVPVHEAATRRALLRAFPLAEADGLFGWATKLRLGGVNPGDHPEPEPVAGALVDVYRAGAAFKATAGLHHPVRHFNAGAGEHMHGFLNVFGAAALLHAGAIRPPQVVEVLHEEDTAAFASSGDAFAWRDASASAGEIAAARSTFALSFGSCSFGEPLEDLAALGY